jgi:tetratricopeptide (TPR) repeat protein
MFWAGRAWAYNGLKDYSKALSDASEAIRLKSDFALPFRERAEANKQLGNQLQADADLRRARQLDPALAIRESK